MVAAAHAPGVRVRDRRGARVRRAAGLPLLLVVAIPPLARSTTAVVWIYAIGLCADIVAAFVLLGLCMRYRERTLRGELFAIRYVTPIADRVFRLER